MGDIIPNQLFVAGYGKSKVKDERDVKDIFKKYGQITGVAYKGSYSFVTFATDSEAQEALKATNGQTVNGQKLKVDLVDNRKGRKTGPSDEDKCFKCNRGGHWARDCPNNRSPRKRRYSEERSKRRRRRSDSRSSRSYSSDRRKRSSRKEKKRYSRSPKRSERNRRRSPSPKRSPSNSESSKRQHSASKS